MYKLQAEDEKRRNEKLSEKIKNFEKEIENNGLCIDKLNKANEFYKQRIQNDSRKDLNRPNQQEQTARKLREVLIHVGRLKDQVKNVRHEALEMKYYKVKLQNNLEILKLRMYEEIKKTKLAESNTEKLKRELAFF